MEQMDKVNAVSRMQKYIVANLEDVTLDDLATAARILSSIPPAGSDLAPDEAIRITVRNYIEAALSFP